jgi:hypothetical protein
MQLRDSHAQLIAIQLHADGLRRQHRSPKQ